MCLWATPWEKLRPAPHTPYHTFSKPFPRPNELCTNDVRPALRIRNARPSVCVCVCVCWLDFLARKLTKEFPIHQLTTHTHTDARTHCHLYRKREICTFACKNFRWLVQLYGCILRSWPHTYTQLTHKCICNTPKHTHTLTHTLANRMQLQQLPFTTTPLGHPKSFRFAFLDFA